MALRLKIGHIGMLCLVVFAGRLPAGPSDSVFWEDNVGLDASKRVQLTVSQHQLELAPITASELIHPGDPDLGPQQRFAVAGAGRLTSHGGLQLPPVKSMVRRDIEGLWRLTLPADAPLLRADEPVSVALMADEGRGADLLDRIRVEPVIHDERMERDGRRRIDGGVVLWVPVEVLERAENLRFRLNIQAGSL